MSFKSKVLIGTSCGLIILSGAAMAAPKADTNQDGQITQAEFIAAANTRFVKMDSNFDGVIDSNETQNARDNRRNEKAEKRFAKLDANSDGFISKDEYNSLQSKRQARQAERRQKRRAATGGEGIDSDTSAKRLKKSAKAKDRKARRGHIRRDANKDGLITKAEYDAATLAMFARLDANGDGVLTKGEGRKRRKGKRRK